MMKKIELVTGISSSLLGFGCAPIMGAVDARTAKRAIALAMDYGINHFDLARSYGYGEAEYFVGNLLKKQRDKVVIASKFGIKANWKAEVLKPVKPFIRYLSKWKRKTGLQPSPLIEVQKVGIDHFHDRVTINSKEMIKSLENSLKSLQTDYLDYFFVHEPLNTIHDYEDLFGVVADLKKAGKIRAFGLAFMQNQQYLHSAYLDRFDLLQFNNSPGATHYNEIVAERGDRPNVIFSPLRGGGVEISPDQKFKMLFKDFSKTVILCSMYNEKHITANAELAG